MAVSVSRRLGEDIAWLKAGLSSNLPSPSDDEFISSKIGKREETSESC